MCMWFSNYNIDKYLNNVIFKNKSIFFINIYIIFLLYIIKFCVCMNGFL